MEDDWLAFLPHGVSWPVHERLEWLRWGSESHDARHDCLRPKSFSPPLNPAGDNIFNFTTINVGPGVIVKLTSRVLTGPVTWLAQGSVTISGTIDMNGEDGSVNSTIQQTERLLEGRAGIPAESGASGVIRGCRAMAPEADLSFQEEEIYSPGEHSPEINFLSPLSVDPEVLGESLATDSQ